MMSSKPVVRGFGFGSGTAFAAVPDAYTDALFPLPFLEGHSFGVSYQTHRQERTEKRIDQ
jgi:hypothetical protein